MQIVIASPARILNLRVPNQLASLVFKGCEVCQVARWKASAFRGSIPRELVAAGQGQEASGCAAEAIARALSRLGWLGGPCAFVRAASKCGPP